MAIAPPAMPQIRGCNEATFEKLVSSCPVLEELIVSVVRNDPKFYRVHSRSLKKLTFVRISTITLDSVSGTEIDAPLLGVLRLYDDGSYSFVVNNMESNAKLEISRGRRFIEEKSHPQYSALDLEAIHDYSRLEPLPQFRSLSRLFVALFESDLKCLPTFLESCPNLKSLILELNYDEEMSDEEMSLEEMNQISYSSVPECWLSSLEFVEFKSPISRHDPVMELVKYFLGNSEILEILTLRVKDDYDISKELLKIPRCSTSCQVVVI